ncbi:SprT family zinc-dependent metalloprotease [Lacimicrobium alkaliphilum]|uniref:Protein SprT n=1 Tax=Lacimicrobium alkaliphilum TaxID=1526571 RepID=A0ABQ1RH03_9ALTE|nr:SprT family zinc-dependent metalloprotease [Lacimicrobium alkaliphilum]GGD68147.1 protein SprT [Lacimicrobium alkaliphilum]
MTELTDHIRQQAHQCLQQSVAKASDILQRDIALPELSFKQRGRIAGSARLQDYEIRLNPVLLTENLDEFIREVIPHELCHLLVWQLYGRGSKKGRIKPHGQEWKALMWTIFGLRGSACHQMDIQSVQGRHFSYRCNCGPVSLSIRRHNKVRQGVKYICRACRQQLQAA